MPDDPIRRCNLLGYQCKQVAEDEYKVEGKPPMTLKELLAWLVLTEQRHSQR